MKRVVIGATFVSVVLGVGVLAIQTGHRTQGRVVNEDQLSSMREVPPALGRHLDRLGRAIPGQGGESEGPGDAEAEKFLAKAYPDTDIPLARLSRARTAAARVRQRGFARDPEHHDSWQSVGPSVALYPFTEFRNSFNYVPNTYVASGRTTAIAIDPRCTNGHCRLWIFAAGGGVWRTKNALSGQPHWKFLSGEFGIQSGSSITLDPNDSSGDTLYVGTGEANASGDSAAGVGMYKSTDGGDRWIGPLGASVFAGRAIGSIAVRPGDPDTIYAATTRAVLGISSVSGGGVSLIPGAAAWGLYKSTDGGSTWTFLHNGSPLASECDTVAEAIAVGSPCSLRGVRRVALDPLDPDTVYAGSYARGVWRSEDAGATWVQIKASLNPNTNTMRPELAVTELPNGKTRMYVYEGAQGTPSARLFRSDDVATGAPAFANLSNSSVSNPGYATHNLCTGQCWYDSFVYTPAGHPDIVYIGGSYSYGENLSNKRGVMLSTDAGATATDMTMDATDQLHPNGLHPDQHALVTNPDDPFQFFEVNDGGVMRSNGEFEDVSAFCDDPDRGLVEPALGRCRQLLSRVPAKLTGMNKGLTTLQFQSLSVSPFNARLLQGGTQDNGTWETPGNPVKWENTMIGDGGQSGFDAANHKFRFHTFFDASPDVNFSKGDIADWNWIGDPIFGTGGFFYVPIISDPVVSKTMFVGAANVWRTKTWGMGSMTLDEFRGHCNEWTGDFAVVCGDWVQIASPSLVSAALGTRAGSAVSSVERARSDTSTAWASTGTGRVFISKNVNAERATAVTWTRIDLPTTPDRFVSSIYVSRTNANRAWVSYTGFDATTPATPGHVFEVTYDPVLGTATWVDRSYDLDDIPITDIARDDVKGDLYAASDFGVYRLRSGATSWSLAADGMPNVEVAGLTIVPHERRLYAATHGMGAWLLKLP